MDMTELKDKINNFLDKQQIELKEKYFIIKSLEEDYLTMVYYEDAEEDDIEEDDFEDFEEIQPKKTIRNQNKKVQLKDNIEEDVEEDDIEEDEDIEKEIEEELNKTKHDPKLSNNNQHRTGIKNLIKKVIPKKPSTHEG
jgi:hypothetical protein